MASTYSTNLRLELVGTGEQQGVWGVTTNNNLGTLLEQAITGYASITVTDGADTVLSTANGASDESRNMTINLAGALTATRNVICPGTPKVYIVKNSTTGGYAVTFKVTGQTGVSIPNGATYVLYVDGTDARQATGSVASGGTGTTTSTGTGSVVLSTSPTLVTPNLGTPSAVTLTSATGLPLTTGVTGTLPVANGGTGVTTSTGSGSNVLSASPTLTGTPLLGSNKIDAFASGTKLLFQQTSAPTGWTKDTSQNDKALRVVSGAAGTGGTTAFSSVFTSRTPAGSISSTTSTGTVGSTTDTGTVGSTTDTGTVGGTALTESQIPSHRHYVVANTSGGAALTSSNYVNRIYDGTTNLDYSLRGNTTDASLGLSSATGGGGTHTHSLSMNAHSHSLTMNAHSHSLSMNAHSHSFSGTAMDFAVQYVDVIIAQKD